MVSNENQDREEGSGAAFVRSLPSLIALVGLVGSSLLLFSLRNREADAARTAFELAAADRAADVERQLRLVVEQLHSVVGLFDSSERVTQEEFHEFTRRSLERHDALRVITWIKDPTDGGMPVFTVRFAEGPDSSAAPPDSDLGGSPALREAFLRARGSRSEVLSSPQPPLVAAPVGAEPGPWVLALVPAYSRADLHHGFVGGFVDLARLLASVGGGRSGLVASLEEGSEAPPASAVAAEPSERAVRHPLSFGGRRWDVVVAAAPGSFARELNWKAWGAFLLGVLATGFLATAVAAATSRARVQKLVDRRSREIQAAYDTLAHEAQQRLWAMMETRQTQRRLREIIDLVPDWIYVKDRFGRFLLANQAVAKAFGKSVEELTQPASDKVEPESPELERMRRAERALVDEQRSTVTPPSPFVDAHGRRHLLRTAKIPITFEDDTRALLCVATDVTQQELATDTLRRQNAILADLARGTDPELVLAQLVRAAEELVPGMRCSILLVSSDGRHLRHGYAPSLPDYYNAAVDGIEIGPGVGSCGTAAHSGKRVIVEDVLTHPAWEPARDLARRAGIRASWSEPIRSSEGEILGTFAMYYSTARAPDAHELLVMESWAHLAGIAIERRRLTAKS